MSSAPIQLVRPIETLRDAIYRGDWAAALEYGGHRDPVVRQYIEVVHTISPTIRAFWTSWCRDSDRAAVLLEPLAGEVLGTQGEPTAELRRQWMILDWLVREWAPVWLALRDDLVVEVAALRDLPPVEPGSGEAMEAFARELRDLVWRSSLGVVRGVRGNEARQMAYDAARHAALNAAWEAVFGPPRGYFTEPSLYDSHVGVVVMNAVRDIAWDAALNVARTTALACSPAGLRTGAMGATIARLESSAVELVRRLCDL